MGNEPPMKARLICFLLLLSASIATAAVQSTHLLSLRLQKAGYENIIWAEQRAKIGKESVAGYIQGVGGADDALIAYRFKSDWDMFEATIGYLSTAPEGRTAEFSVEAGGQVLYSSGELKSKSPGQVIRVPIKGHRQVLLRISGERYNHTSGAAWGEPKLYRGLSAAEMQTSWNLDVNGRKTPLSGNGPPAKVVVPFDVPASAGEEQVYTVKVRRDATNRTVIVERTDGKL